MKRMTDKEILKAMFIDSPWTFKIGLAAVFAEIYNKGASEYDTYGEILRARYSAIKKMIGESPTYPTMMQERIAAFMNRKKEMMANKSSDVGGN